MIKASEMTGKVALVTGAASGLGCATALKMAQTGADLCLVEVNDVADMIVFLASDAAQGYHGSIVSIDKGITAG